MSQKIGILTLHSVKNYGSVLQTLATQILFTDLGFETEVIDYRRRWETEPGYYFYSEKEGVKKIFDLFRLLPTKIKQKKVFGRFLAEYINISEQKYCNEEDLKKNLTDYDIYCVGSDQVWNSGWNRGLLSVYFLNFIGKNKKKISYSSSFGGWRLMSDEKKIVQKFLKEFCYVSVREESSLVELNGLGIKNGYVVLDPTLQIERKTWDRLVKSRKPKYSNYTLLIQLNHNKEFDRFAIKFSNNRNETLLRLCLRYDQIILPGKHVLIPEVLDYINLIKYANFVLTDSFHAISFCLNFNKQFFCVYPKKYPERLMDILKRTGLINRVINNFDKSELYNCIINYENVNLILEKEREKGRLFLIMATKSSN